MKRDANDTSSNPQTQPDPMAINETNSGQIVNGNFTDTSNGAEIPTVATESAMDAASTIPGWQVVNSQQTQIPLVWGPKVLPSYTYVTFDKTNNKIGAVLSKYSDNLSYGRPDNNVGPIYQDIDVTPGSELQFHFIGTSMGNISDLTVLVYLSMMQIILQLYYIKVHLKQVANLLVFLKGI